MRPISRLATPTHSSRRRHGPRLDLLQLSGSRRSSAKPWRHGLPAGRAAAVLAQPIRADRRRRSAVRPRRGVASRSHLGSVTPAEANPGATPAEHAARHSPRLGPGSRGPRPEGGRHTQSHNTTNYISAPSFDFEKSRNGTAGRRRWRRSAAQRPQVSRAPKNHRPPCRTKRVEFLPTGPPGWPAPMRRPGGQPGHRDHLDLCRKRIEMDREY